MSDHPADRRRFKRIAFDARTELRQGEHTWPVKLIDLSLKGLLIERPAPWLGNPQQNFSVGIHLSDDTDIANLLAALGNRVRFDASQSLNTSQQSQARSNIAAAATAHTHAISEVSGLQNVLDGKSNVGHTHSASDMGAVSATAVGNTDTDFVSAFVSALS